MKRPVAAVVIAALVAAACGDSTGPNTPDGSYGLSTVNGNKVPYTLYADGAYRQEITNGTLTLRGDGKYVAKTTTTDYITGVNPQVYLDSTWGTWVRTGIVVTFTDALDQSKATGDWQGSTLTISQGTGASAMTIVYKR